jgi:two-component system, cell cycle sensor histidine kinase and response regulator CckA
VLVPRVLDLNSVFKDMDHMLRRLIREDIGLIIRTDPELWLVRADPAQMEQVIINLAVNASDAMPHGGLVTLETRNIQLDRAVSRQDPALRPGRYVLLSVTDVGIGMDPETKARIFEPFFTTKELTKGTGLGLATVYGIVQQSGGHISVYSELGKGSTFNVYLPRAEGKLEAARAPATLEAPPRGAGTVLLVEDDAAVRGLAREVLQEQGYTVLPAANGEEALQIVETYQGRIDLLMTDVIMPGMAGDELVEHLRLQLPDLKVVFVSGYASDAIPKIMPDEHTAFLQKPFPVEDLVRKVYEMTAGATAAKANHAEM